MTDGIGKQTFATQHTGKYVNDPKWLTVIIIG
jgi:hypothetical protein